MHNMFVIKVLRGNPQHQYWEEFELKLTPYLNVISALMEIQENPINRKGERTTPVVWEQGCLEEVCGSCSMLINGSPRQACSAIIRPILAQTRRQFLSLAPLTKFPLLRDLCVDRQEMFDHLCKVQAWISSDGSCAKGPGPKISQRKQEIAYTLSTCMSCGCCAEACPQMSSRSHFMGPAPISQVRLCHLHPTGRMEKYRRLHTLMGRGGVSECGNAQNCVRVCPKRLPLTESIAAMGREVSMQALREIFSLADGEQ